MFVVLYVSYAYLRNRILKVCCHVFLSFQSRHKINYDDVVYLSGTVCVRLPDAVVSTDLSFTSNQVLCVTKAVFLPRNEQVHIRSWSITAIGYGTS